MENKDPGLRIEFVGFADTCPVFHILDSVAISPTSVTLISYS